MAASTRTDRRRLLGGLLALVMLVGCSSSSDGTSGGHDSPRAVVDAHIAHAANRELVEDCELRSPAVIEAMASLDDTEADGYCDFAVGDQPEVSEEVAAEAERLYTGMAVEQIEEGEGLASFRLTSADGSYTEWIETVEVDGRWYISEATDDGGDHEHEHDEDGHDHGEDGHGVDEHGEDEVSDGG